jgi:putative two-component system response regulator
MHDVGKIGIPDHILQKPGKLTPDEWTLMSRHPVIGADIIGVHQDELLQAAHTIALYHHEKWDGSGYPSGLAGEAIPLFARIAAIADVFDALTMARAYKAAWSTDVARDFIAQQAGLHFDPTLVAHFLQIYPQILQIKQKYDEELGLIESDEV